MNGPDRSSENAAGAAGIPRELHDESRLPPLVDPRSPVAERYRRLRTHLEHLGERQGRQVRSVVVSSSREGEGKTLTAMNLALVFAENRDHPALLVDGDLHRMQVGKMFRRPPRIGLMDLYEGRADVDAAVVRLVKSSLHVLPAGGTSGVNAAEVFKSERFREVLRSLRQRYHRIVFDSPPVMRFVDASILNEHADGMIFVVRAGLTSRQMVRKAVASVTSGSILGMVINDVRYSALDRFYYGYDEYGRSYFEE